MKIEAVQGEKILNFIDYCKKYRREVDDSYLYDEDLREFQPNEENPTYILINDENIIVGAVSLIIDSYYKNGKRGRFRIFHTVLQKKEAYELMLNAILQHTDEINKVFLFIKEENDKTAAILKSLNFNIERYAFTLVRDSIDTCQPVFPKGFFIRTFQLGKDEDDWCEVRNEAFAKLAGSETPKTPEMISKMAKSEDLLEGGMRLLYHDKKAVGQVCISKEFDNGTVYTFISSLSVKPEYHGIGLGRNLLREAICYGKGKGISKSMLTVNAENDKAVELYIKEGFKKADTVVCYNYQLKKEEE